MKGSPGECMMHCSSVAFVFEVAKTTAEGHLLTSGPEDKNKNNGSYRALEHQTFLTRHSKQGRAGLELHTL